MSKTLLRPSFIQPEDLLDKLYKAYLADKIEELPEQEQKVLERMEYADAKLREGGSVSRYSNLVNDMLHFFKGHNVTRRTIENDIARAKRFFLSARPREEKEYGRGKHIEWLERVIVEAREAGEFRALPGLFRELKDYQGYMKEDPNRPDYENFERKPILVITDPKQIGVPEIENLEEELAKLRGSKKDYMSAFGAEDVEFEEEQLDE